MSHPAYGGWTDSSNRVASGGPKASGTASWTLGDNLSSRRSAQDATSGFLARLRALIFLPAYNQTLAACTMPPFLSLRSCLIEPTEVGQTRAIEWPAAAQRRQILLLGRLESNLSSPRSAQDATSGFLARLRALIFLPAYNQTLAACTRARYKSRSGAIRRARLEKTLSDLASCFGRELHG